MYCRKFADKERGSNMKAIGGLLVIISVVGLVAIIIEEEDNKRLRREIEYNRINRLNLEHDI